MAGVLRSSNRGVMMLLVVVGTAVFGLAAGRWAGNVAVGVAAAGTLAVAMTVSSLLVRRAAEAKMTASLARGHLVTDALLDFSCLPWRLAELAPETQRALGADPPGLRVTVTASDAVLRLEQRRYRLITKYPLVAQVPLACIDEIRVGKSRLFLGGSSLSVALCSDELRIDLGSATIWPAGLPTHWKIALGRLAVYSRALVESNCSPSRRPTARRDWRPRL